MRNRGHYIMGKRIIGKNEYEVEERIMFQQEILFWTENPRVYSVLRENGNDNPSQSEIEALMKTTENVKELKVQIEQNGGLIEPLTVVRRGDDYVAIEGNSRLAAYRILAEGNPTRWSKLSVNVLPETITDTELFIYVGTIHLVKKKDWTVFEQAAYVYRQMELQKCPYSTLAKQVGLTGPTVKKYIDVYKFMVDNNDTVQSHWNYYEQYVTSKGIKSYRDKFPEMDDRIVGQIKNGKIKQAKDIRDKLGKIAKARDKTSNRIMRDVIAGKTDIDEAYIRFEATGKSGNNYVKIKEFRSLMTSDEFSRALKAEAVGNNAILFELKKIKKEIDKMINELDM